MRNPAFSFVTGPLNTRNRTCTYGSLGIGFSESSAYLAKAQTDVQCHSVGSGATNDTMWSPTICFFSHRSFTPMPFFSVDALDRTEEMPGFLGAFVHSENMTVVNWTAEAGATVPEHSHPHEQFSMVVEGEFELTLDGETDVLRPGRLALIPSDVPHSGRARTDCEIVDVFSPMREAYRHEGDPVVRTSKG